jgi:ubiquinone/menaquinone biosynthesis C-methylase UbiE
MAYIDFISVLHKKTSRDYLARVAEFPKAKAAKIAKQFGKDYWDGDRRVGYGGMNYDGRWRVVAEKMAAHYCLSKHSKILDIGCGKGFLLYEFTQIIPGISVRGIDISEYAINNAKKEIAQFLQVGNANSLPYRDEEFDLVYSITTLHNLHCYDLDKSLREISRVSKCDKYISVESYRTEEEKANLLYWQLTCEAFCTPKEWEWWFRLTGYDGDWGFIYFE